MPNIPYYLNAEIEISSSSCNISTSLLLASSNLTVLWEGGTFIGNCSSHSTQEDSKRLVVFITEWNGSVLRNQGVILCRPLYTMNNSMVTLDASGGVTSVQLLNQSEPIPNVSEWDIMNAVMYSIDRTSILEFFPVFGDVDIGLGSFIEEFP
jgi:hypothetical protein